MSEPIRSATVLVDKVLSSPDTIRALKTDPIETLRSLEYQVITGLPRRDDRAGARIWTVVVAALALLLFSLAGVLGVSVMTRLDAVASHAVGSSTVLSVFTSVVGFLSGLLVTSPSRGGS